LASSADDAPLLNFENHSGPKGLFTVYSPKAAFNISEASTAFFSSLKPNLMQTFCFFKFYHFVDT
jgi:hypothetical protein